MASSVLRYRADLRTLAFVAFYFFLATVTWLRIDDPWYIVAPLVVLNCLFSFFCATIVHNTIHCPIFRKKWMNKAFQVVLSFTYGHPVSAYVPGHNFSHHKHTQSEKDNIRTTKARFRWNLLNQLLFFYLMSFDILKSEMRFVRKMKQEKPAWYKQYLFESILLNGVRLGLLLLDWRAFLFVVLIPHQYAAWGIVGTNYWQHEGCDENHPYNHSRNFTGKLLNWFAFNNGYHGMHHEKPGMHWSLLPAAHKALIEPHIHPNLNRESLTKYLWESCIWPGKRVDYLGNPIVLPPKKKDKDWVADLPVRQHSDALGAIQ
jgi:fatty acid desaturase